MQDGQHMLKCALDAILASKSSDAILDQLQRKIKAIYDITKHFDSVIRTNKAQVPHHVPLALYNL